MPTFPDRPSRTHYDVVIIGGAIHGSSTAFFLTENPDFDGTILVLEKDSTYAKAATSLTNSCIRQQFSHPLNARISQFGAEFIHNFREFMGGSDLYPNLAIRNFGYLYLAATDRFANTLRTNHAAQISAGAATQLLSRDEIAAAYPFFVLDDVILGSLNTVDEGWFDGTAVFDGFRRRAGENGAEYVANEVTEITRQGDTVQSVTLATGEVVGAGQVVDAAGTRSARVAEMAGLSIPVEPRKRFSWIFTAETPLDRDLPLTIDPSGIHMRQDAGQAYLAGATPALDPAVDPDDFTMDDDIWVDRVWPTLAARIPLFEAIRVISEWAGHYDTNVLDHNAILGPHPELKNFHFQCGFSGHGLQQSPAMGRGMSEMLTYGEYRSLDLTPFSVARVLKGEPFIEGAII